MSKTILAEVDGFTPVIDDLVKEVGLMSAVVFGRVWRYCQMEDQVCKAALESIADSIGVDRVTVMRHVKQLCELGYLDDLTPELRNRPHVYVDTGKAGLKLSLKGVAQSNTNKKGVAQRNVAESESKSTVTQGNVAVAESNLNIDIKKEIKESEKDNYLFTLQELAQSIFPDYMTWNNIKRRLQRSDISITGDNSSMVIHGLKEKPKGGQFTQAQIWQDNIAPYFAKYGVAVRFEE
jgi:hypothetical protein